MDRRESNKPESGPSNSQDHLNRLAAAPQQPAAGQQKNSIMTLKSILLTAGLGLALGANLFAADVVRYEGQPAGSKVRMDGDSTIHKWYAESTVVSGFMEFDKGFALADVKPGPVAVKVETVIPVRTLKSSSGRAMDNVMYNAMATTNFTKIEFRLASLECKEAAKGAVPAKFEAKGNLVVMGNTNPITMVVTMESPEKDRIIVKTAEKLKMKMTTYKIAPPVLNLGIMKINTDDNIDLGFEWVTAVKAAEAAK